jgi:tetratricopeptide (TPR) repeat protein
LAKVYLLQEKWDQAEKWAAKLVAAGEKSAQELLDAAKAKQAPDSLKQPVAVAGEVQQGWAALNSGDTVRARELFQEAIKTNPKDSNGYNGLGWLQLNLGEVDEAKGNFETALKLDPGAAGAMNGLARALKQQDKIDEAIKVWEQMVTQFKGVHAGTYGLAGAYMEKKQYDKAIPLYEQIVKANPNDQEAKQQLEAAKLAAKAG